MRTMRSIRIAAFALVALYASAGATTHAQEDQSESVLDARQGFETKLTRSERFEEPLIEPPAELFTIARYDGPAGKLSGTLSARPEGDSKHPAMIWITGGFPPGGIGSDAWERATPDNDQSAKAYREAGLAMLYPTFRGSFGNDGVQEGFYGEVDDVLAAADYLRTLDWIDAERIYLGGHSTGATLALLAASASPKFRGVFAFGPVAAINDYGEEALPFDLANPREVSRRSPGRFISSIRCPTWVIEGTDGPSNVAALHMLELLSESEHVRFVPIEGANHRSVLAPLNARIASVLANTGAGAPLAIDAAVLQAAYDAQHAAFREANDLDSIADLRRDGRSLDEPCVARFVLWSWEREALEAAAAGAKSAGFDVLEIDAYEDDDGDAYYVLAATKRIVPRELDPVFAASAALDRIAREHGVAYDGWAAQ